MIQILSILLCISLSFAIGFGFLGYSYLLGYITTGIMLSRILNHNPENIHIIENLGELGLLLLIFMIGIEFNLIEFKQRWKQSTMVFSLQAIFSMLTAAIINFFYPMSLQLNLLLVCLFILSSTGIVFKLLDETGRTDTPEGSLISSILILQDLAVIPMVIILNNSNANNLVFNIFWKVLLAVIIIICLVQYLGRQSNKTLFRPLKILFNNNNETITLAALTVCFTFAAISEKLGLSNAYGPFIAGLIIGSFSNKHEIVQFAKPIESLLMMIFFIFVGSKINVEFVQQNWQVITLLSLVLFLIKFFLFFFSLILSKKIFNYINGTNKRYEPSVLYYISIILAQSSEFSFSFLAILMNKNFLSEYMVNLGNTLIVISLTLGALLPILYEKFRNDE